MGKETNGRYREKPTHEELLAALRIIRAECLSHDLPEACTACPLRAADDPTMEKNFDCAVAASYPFKWRIKTADDSAWRAFYDV